MAMDMATDMDIMVNLGMVFTVATMERGIIEDMGGIIIGDMTIGIIIGDIIGIVIGEVLVVGIEGRN